MCKLVIQRERKTVDNCNEQVMGFVADLGLTGRTEVTKRSEDTCPTSSFAVCGVWEEK